jgi:hypothetical protein
MSDINVKECNELVQSLKKILWGVQTHKNDHGFPRDITEEAINALIEAVEKSRRDYDAALARMKEVTNAYQTDFTHGLRNLSRFSGQLIDLYGAQSPIIKQFGLKPPKEGKSSKKKAAV